MRRKALFLLEFLLLVVVVKVCFLPVTSFAQVKHQRAVPGDVDGDQVSDLSLVFISHLSKSTFWFSRLQSGSMTLYQFPFEATAVALADFDGDQKGDPLIISDKGLNQPLEWNIITETQGRLVLSFGLPGDTPVPADYDCDGKADLAVRRVIGGFSHWYFQLSTATVIHDFIFGLGGDRVFGADVDGDGCAELISLRPINGELHWFSRSLPNKQGVINTTTPIHWGLPGDIPLAPIDLNGDGHLDVVVVRTINSQQIALVRFSDSLGTTVPLGPVNSIPLSGNFTGSKILAYFDRNQGALTIKNVSAPDTSIPFNYQSALLYIPEVVTAVSFLEILGLQDMAHIQELLKKANINDMVVPSDGSVAFPPSIVSPETGPPVGGPRPEPNPNLPCEQKTFRDGKGKALWKPVSVGKNAGRPTILMPYYCEGITRVELMAKNKTLVTKAKLRSCSGPEGRPIYDVSLSGSKLKKFAPLIVRVTFTDGTCEDRTVKNPKARYD